MFRLTFLILLTINFPLTAVKLKPEIISLGDWELIVNMTILETWDETWASYLRRARPANAFGNQQRYLITVSDRIQIPSKTTYKDTDRNKGKCILLFY